MHILKCKMCGGSLEIDDTTKTVIVCDYCGTSQTIPKADNEDKIRLYRKANQLRFNLDFSSASIIYQKIITEFPKEAEAYWGLLLCKYGIQYVDDPKTGKKIPTCHRTEYKSILDDEDYKNVVRYSDVVSRDVYKNEALEIDRVQKGILKIASSCEAFDVFICYKDTDENGERTEDSVLAQKIYSALKNEGYKVFYSRVTLQNVLGSDYEPYIYNALRTSEAMIHVTTSIDNSESVWVKNEWNRFLQMAKNNRKKLIPAFKNITAYELPKEMQPLQGQDLGKIGAIENIVLGINKIFEAKNYKGNSSKTTITKNYDSLIKKGHKYLNANEFNEASSVFKEAVHLSDNPYEAYFGLLLASFKCKTGDELADKRIDNIENDDNYKLCLAFVDSSNKDFYDYLNQIKEQSHSKTKDNKYQKYIEELDELEMYCYEPKELINIITFLADVGDYREAKKHLYRAYKMFITHANSRQECEAALLMIKEMPNENLEGELNRINNKINAFKIDELEEKGFLASGVDSIYSVDSLCRGINCFHQALSKVENSTLTDDELAIVRDNHMKWMDVIRSVDNYLTSSDDYHELETLLDSLNHLYEDLKEVDVSNAISTVENHLTELKKIVNDKKRKKRNKKILIISIIVGSILVVIGIIVGVVVGNNYKHSPNRISFEVNNKTQKYDSDVSPYINGCYYVYFDYKITNGSSVGISYMDFRTTVNRKSTGEKLGTISTSLSNMYLEGNSSKSYQIYLEDNQPEKNNNTFFITLYNISLSELSFSYEITSISFDDGHYYYNSSYGY